MKFLKKTYACAITGHRPTRFKFKYNEGYSLCKKIKKAMLKTFCHLHDEEGIFRFYVIGQSGTASDYKKRNYYMVDHADFLLAVYDNNRKLRSGTGQTVNYALKQNLRIIFLHPDTAEIS